MRRALFSGFPLVAVAGIFLFFLFFQNLSVLKSPIYFIAPVLFALGWSRGALWSAIALLGALEFFKYFVGDYSSLANEVSVWLAIVGGVLAVFAVRYFKKEAQKYKHKADFLKFRYETAVAPASYEGESALREDRKTLLENFEKYLKNILSLLRSAFGAQTALFLQWDGSKEIFFVRAASSELDSAEESKSVASDTTLYDIALSQKPYLYPRGDASHLAQYYAKKTKISSLATVPVVGAGNKFEGALLIDHPEEDAFRTSHLDWLREWAEYFALALAHWQQFTWTEERSMEIRSLYDIARRMAQFLDISDIAKDLIRIAYEFAPCDAAAVCLFEDSPDAKYKIYANEKGKFNFWEETKTDKSWARWVFENAEGPITMNQVKNFKIPLYSFAEPSEKFHSFFAVPIASAKRRFGTFIAGSFSTEAFDTRTAHILSIISAHASLSLEVARSYKMMEDLAVTDALTGLYNRRYFNFSLDNEIRRSERTNIPVSLLLVDIDHFKQLNDTYGHSAGDKALVQIAKLLRTEVRDIDIVARYGGEEFAVLLVDTDIENAHTTAERLRTKIEKNTKVTVSIGISAYPKVKGSAEELVKKADKALYASKQGGRNKTTLAEE